eukprot:1135063-Prymnesium_polylepis.1
MLAGALHVSSRICSTTARGVGWSNASVDDSDAPLSLLNRAESSVTASESSPDSMIGVSPLTLDAPKVARRCATGTCSSSRPGSSSSLHFMLVLMMLRCCACAAQAGDGNSPSSSALSLIAVFTVAADARGIMAWASSKCGAVGPTMVEMRNSENSSNESAGRLGANSNKAPD